MFNIKRPSISNIFIFILALIAVLMAMVTFLYIKEQENFMAVRDIKDVKKLVVSSVFSNGSNIPKDYTCEGKNISPKLIIENIPKEAKSLAIIMDDPDAPSGVFVHWVVWNLEPSKVIEEGTKKGEQGMTSFGKNGYGGPCPPRGHGNHRYYFKVYALDNNLNLRKNATKEELLKAMEGHILAYGELMGIYRRD